MNVGRILLLVASFRWPKVCRYYHVYQLVYFAVRETAIVSYGSQMNQFMNLALLVIYVLFSFDGWKNILPTLICLCYIQVGCRYLLFDEDISLAALFVNFLIQSSLLTFYCSLFYLSYSWIGFKYLQAELPRVSNEQLL